MGWKAARGPTGPSRGEPSGGVLGSRRGAAETDSRSQRSGPRSGAALRGVGAQRARAPVIKGQNRVRTERRSSAPRRRPRSVRTAPGGSVWTPLWTPRCSVLPKAGPRRLAVPTALDALEAFLPQERKLQRQPRLSPQSELFLSLTCPTHPSGLCPSLHPSTPKLVPHPRVSRFLWALQTPRPAPSSIPSPSPLSRF